MKIIYLLFFTLVSFAQQKKTSLEINYPIPTGNNFIGKYKGVVDVGAKYRFSDQKDFLFGVSLNVNYLTYSMTTPTINSNTKNFNFQPRLFGELKLKGLPRLHPALGLGYTFMKFSSNGDSIPVGENPIFSFSYSENLSGINYNLSISFDFNSKFFAQVQYDGIKINSVPDGVPNTKYNTSADLIKLGLGYRF